MRPLLLALVLTTMQALPPQVQDYPTRTVQDIKKQADGNQRSAVKSKSLVDGQTADRNKTNHDGTAGENTSRAIEISKLPIVTVAPTKRDFADWAYWIFSGLLVGVGSLQVFLLCWSLKVSQRQAHVMIRQARILRRQAASMERQTKATEDAANSADKNIEMFISKERARLKINLSDLKLIPETDTGVYLVEFTVSIFGTTPAFVSDNRCVAYVDPSDWIDNEGTGDKAMTPMQGLPNMIPPNGKPNPQFAIFHFSRGDDSEAIMGEIKADRLFVGIRGFIKYKDVFDRERETNFRYVWKYEGFPAPPDMERWGRWEKCGKEEENRET